MPKIDLSYMNVALNSLAFLMVLILFLACLSERGNKRREANQFLGLLFLVSITLISNIFAWIGEGRVHLRMMTLVADTATSCFSQITIIAFMGYLYESLYQNSKAVACIVNIFRVFGAASVVFSFGNAFFGYAFVVDEAGHYVQSSNTAMVICHELFSFASFVTLVLMALLANRSSRANRAAFVIYTVLPMVGLLLDYTFHGLSLTYICIALSVLILYTNIYLQKQKLIDAQKNALMLSQINPHFTYNTLTTIAAMCDVSPRLAKNLTIDFSHYLRHNLDTLTSEHPIPFDKELAHIECYLKIEKARFGERLNVIYSIQCKDFSIPPLTVQPIVENAVKHGITKRAQGGTIKISTYSIDQYYVVEVIDDGVGFDTESMQGHAKGVGLENVESRVKRMCRGTLSIKSTLNVGTRVKIVIPKRKGKKHDYSGS